MSELKEIARKDLDDLKLKRAQKQDLKQLLEECQEYIGEVNEKQIEKAFKLCYLSHDGMVRASGEPYYYHPVEVAKIVAREINIDEISVIAALLHDTVEDTSVTLDDIEYWFGKQVAVIINGVTKIEGVFKSRDSKQAETFMKLLLSMAEDIRVVLIKFADRLHNMRTIHHLKREKQMKIANETMDLYAPLAHRFGLFRIKNELEDLCFKTLDPTSFKFVARKLKEKKESREKFIKQFMTPIQKQLKELKLEFEIKGRPKHIYSIYKKMQRQQKPFEEIYDLFAIRVILETPHTKEDCWRVYSIFTDWYTPIPERFRDFISVPKANGYQSLHTTVITNQGKKVEVQIRTRKMDDIAEKGLAAHWKYKEGEQEGSESLDKFVNWVRDVLDNPRPDAATDFVKDFQLNLYQEELYVFTPKGELTTLPNGATAIDFAFDIHSEVGERAMAAKVNGKMVPLRQKLSNGDQVEILTGNKINLNVDWIDDVVTHKAKSRIRQFIKQKERTVSDEGKAIWDKRAERGKVEISDQELTKFAKMYDFTTTQDLFYAIGAGSFDVNRLFSEVKKYKSTGRIDEEQVETTKVTEDEIQKKYINEARSIGDGKSLIINGELSNVKYSYANCCNPIPGDDVIGFISRTGDIKIHRSMCNNALHLIKTEGERIVDVDWSKNLETKFLGAVKVIGEDRVGMINDITDVLSKSLSTNMKSINVNSDSGMFEGIISIYVDGLQHLKKIMKRLERVEGVKNVLRYE
ncbi:MAG: bifunctional (p)ppGpp synthetase/guanosine-3',5'-bis(diphosphate) 3'-pyrophosphohydrolase [Balneola sp.]|nr:bifunctional (p)ppGpp synthetase/guanosine-3',5'-bis(diphosphate) 3'-pyrophosphohydrolase [Balneola sp.]MBO6650839.1 bifunctional (p)ppGpp synthetase/guanosine-3',5'-bis(diphosphate) 3'-pyrophosphohydrolase [Balneola sp.]MBO6710052.1 bifunctional (p)ppGpp synthetase/guanosine-3',5'-bis(diphosphate) 3'-pyrophosphohydrolase [Balneola sp.]MBO6798736.1 bifunctional (p)ppGpp synthetase/guanosine-3',5'-bis(diphosphate) 3'-pyrophosphohydrolase [Balneola sp.]MBO6869850.1 bifunctional (p)ppGpp synthe